MIQAYAYTVPGNGSIIVNHINSPHRPNAGFKWFSVCNDLSDPMTLPNSLVLPCTFDMRQESILIYTTLINL